MSFFNKKHDDILSYKDSWVLFKADDGNLIIRFNIGIKDAAGHPKYPIRMGITVPIPGLRDHDLSESIEDFIIQYLQNGKHVVLAGVINKLNDDNFIEFMCYAPAEIDFESFHQSLEAAFPNQEIQMYAKQDPAWEGYLYFSDEV